MNLQYDVTDYTYNAWNLMESASVQKGNVRTDVTFSYDATDRRNGKTTKVYENDYLTDSTTTEYIWYGDKVQYEEVKHNTITDTKVNLWGVSGLAARNNEIFSSDAHGNTDEAYGTTTKRYIYDAYGNQINENADDDNPYRYCGENYDEETGLYYLRARYYDPSIGRFLSEDPAQDGLNWYVYCGNNPVVLIDSGGLRSEGELIRVGSGSVSDVKAIQNKLNYLGYSDKMGKPLVVDGLFGQNTKYAVTQYQKDNGLAVDGIVGDNTWNSLQPYYINPYNLEFKPAPKKQIVGFDINFGVGLYAEFDVMGISAEIGGKSYYSLSDIAVRPSITSEASVGANILSILSAGVSGRVKIDTVSREVLERDGYAGIKIGNKVIGLDSLTNGSDIIVSLGIGAYLGAGGEAHIDLNLSELFKSFK